MAIEVTPGKKNRQHMEQENPLFPKTGNRKQLFAVALQDIGPLLDMPAIDPTAVTFHKYADAKNRTSRHGTADLTMPLADYFRILWELSVALQDETIHLSSRHLMPGSTSFILSNIAGCRTLGEAMKLIAKSYNLLHGGPYNRVELREDSLLYIIDDSQFPYVSQEKSYIHFTMECVQIYLHGILSFITSVDLQPWVRKIYTKRERGPIKSRHMAYWKAPLRHHAGPYTLMYDREAAALPITIDDRRMPSSREIYDHVISLINNNAETGGSLSEKVCRILEQSVRDQQDVARRLGYSVATLRRRLAQEDTSFRTLSQEALNQKSKHMLAQGFHMSDIAEDLGFSDFRSFTRAFKGWNNMTPTAYQKTLTQKD